MDDKNEVVMTVELYNAKEQELLELKEALGKANERIERMSETIEELQESPDFEHIILHYNNGIYKCRIHSVVEKEEFGRNAFEVLLIEE